MNTYCGRPSIPAGCVATAILAFDVEKPPLKPKSPSRLAFRALERPRYDVHE